MARAHSIWLVISEDGSPVAAFTVKHELRTWLDKQPEYSTYIWEIWKLPDNPIGYAAISGRNAEHITDWETLR